jgi:hypothetical protein
MAMRNRKLTVAVASACTMGMLAGLGVTALIGSASAASPKAKYDLSVTGTQEVFPPGGDADGLGSAKVVVKGKTASVCVTIKKVLNIDLPATAAHIHQGVAGVDGGIVVNLAPPTAKKEGKPGKSKACATVDATLLNGLLTTPSNFYVNVHTGAFPGGAIRGQLG